MLTAVVEANAVPPVATEYHFIAIPQAVKLAIVGFDTEQNDWEYAIGGVLLVLKTT